MKQRVRGVLSSVGVTTLLACGAYVAGCSSSPGAPAAAPTGTLLGTYFSLTGGDVSEITFEPDGVHYSLLKSGCGGPQVDGEGDNGCIETGTYTLNASDGTLTLLDSATNEARTIPFAVQQTEPSSGELSGVGGGALNSGSTSLTSGSDGGSSVVSCFGAPLTEGNPTSATYGLHCPTQGQVSRDGMIARAETWVDAKVPYCQSANHQADGDKSCASVCNRPGEPSAWDAYRSDCSGFVSWSWGLPAPGRTTGQFGDVSTSIGGNDLQPGDALDRSGVHIILFVRWADSSHTSAVFDEEPGCSANPNYAHQYTSAVKITGSSVYVAFNRETFQAIRFNKICQSSCGVGAGDAGQSMLPVTNGNGLSDAGNPSSSGNPTSTGSGGGGTVNTGTGSGTSLTGGGGNGGSSGGGSSGGGSTGTTPGGGSGGGGNEGVCGTLTECNGTCTDIQTDPDNCGGCSVGCPSMTSCQNGTCQGASCTSDGSCNPGNDGSGLMCGPNHHCIPGCHTDAQCPGNETCASNKCNASREG